MALAQEGAPKFVRSYITSQLPPESGWLLQDRCKRWGLPIFALARICASCPLVIVTTGATGTRTPKHFRR